MIKVHIVDDHKMLVEGLCLSVRESDIAEVCGISHDLASCRNAIAANVPDILLLDINLPDGSGIDFCAEIHEKYPGVKIIALTTHDEYSSIKRMLDNGASGYILKNALSEEVIAGIEAVMRGETFLCEEVDVLLNKKKEAPVWLTAREQELLRLIVDGYTNQEIADHVFLSVETIKTYRKNLILKLGAKNSMMLVRIAMEKKLV